MWIWQPRKKKQQKTSTQPVNKSGRKKKEGRGNEYDLTDNISIKIYKLRCEKLICCRQSIITNRPSPTSLQSHSPKMQNTRTLPGGISRPTIIHRAGVDVGHQQRVLLPTHSLLRGKIWPGSVTTKRKREEGVNLDVNFKGNKCGTVGQIIYFPKNK